MPAKVWAPVAVTIPASVADAVPTVRVTVSGFGPVASVKVVDATVVEAAVLRKLASVAAEPLTEMLSPPPPPLQLPNINWLATLASVCKHWLVLPAAVGNVNE